MNLEQDIIGLYLRVEAACLEVTGGRRLRRCGRLPGLTDAVFAHLFAPVDDVHITDGVPMPICHLARAGRAKLFRTEAAFGFCAAKNEHYYGFKGHVVINLKQQVTGFTFTAANIDEREVLDNLRGVRGLLIGDKGLLSKARQDELAGEGIDLQTPLRDNMEDPRPKSYVKTLLKTRRRVETVIGQLVEFFGFTTYGEALSRATCRAGCGLIDCPLSFIGGQG